MDPLLLECILVTLLLPDDAKGGMILNVTLGAKVPPSPARPEKRHYSGLSPVPRSALAPRQGRLQAKAGGPVACSAGVVAVGAVA